MSGLSKVEPCGSGKNQLRGLKSPVIMYHEIENSTKYLALSASSLKHQEERYICISVEGWVHCAQYKTGMEHSKQMVIACEKQK